MESSSVRRQCVQMLTDHLTTVIDSESDVEVDYGMLQHMLSNHIFDTSVLGQKLTYVVTLHVRTLQDQTQYDQQPQPQEEGELLPWKRNGTMINMTITVLT
jgi:hypothetical protein